MEGFEYVINEPPIPKVAFGTSLPRETLPAQGKCLSSFMRRHIAEVRDFPAPWDYRPKTRLKIFQSASKKGFAVFLNRNPRAEITKKTRIPSQYNIEVPKPIKMSKKPFDSADVRVPKYQFIPGPGYYKTENPIQKLQPHTIFGTIRKFSPAIKVICTPVNKSICFYCEKVPVGDYFRDFKAKIDICRPCMKKKQQALRVCGLDQFERLDMIQDLERFEQCRYCDFKHLHEGTTAAVQILTKLELQNKNRIENYLYPYFKDHPVE